jgi:hypothetical protein
LFEKRLSLGAWASVAWFRSRLDAAPRSLTLDGSWRMGETCGSRIASARSPSATRSSRRAARGAATLRLETTWVVLLAEAPPACDG